MQKSPKYVVVIGAARSGTKFLRGLLGSSYSCTHVPYDVNYVWRAGNLNVPHDALQSNHCNPVIARRINERLQRLSRWRENDCGPYIIEKTVSNCFRIPFINCALEDVRFIHLIRDGRDVLESSLRQWQEPVRMKYLARKIGTLSPSDIRYALWYAGNMLKGLIKRGHGVGVWGVRYPGIEADVMKKSLLEVCALQWNASITSAFEGLKQIPADRQIEIRYEQLITDSSQIDRLCNFLELPDSDRMQANFGNTLKTNSKTRWHDLTPDKNWQAALEIMLPQLNALGYTQEPLSSGVDVDLKKVA